MLKITNFAVLIKTLPLLILLFLVFGNKAEAQTPPGPVLTCVSVSGSSCSIDWVAPDAAVVADFPGVIPIRYKVYRSNALDGSFIPIYDVQYDDALIDFNVLDPTANASSAINYYYVALEYFDTPLLEVKSETVASIFIVMNSETTSTFVGLDWNVEHITDNPSVILQKKVSNTSWLDYFVGNSSFNHHEEFINDCHGFDPDITIAFRVRAQHPSGCMVFSNEIEDEFVDLNPPDDPIIETISVDPVSGEVVIYWTPSVAPDIGGYNILSFNNIPSGVVTDGSLDSYSVSSPPAGNDPTMGPVGYYVAPFDNCLHGTAPGDFNFAPVIPGVSGFHETVFLQVGYDVCTKSIQFDWTGYDDWSQGVSRYVVQGSVDGQPFQELETIAEEGGSYLLSDVAENQNFCFVVVAYPNDNSLPPSYSNKVCLTTSYPEVATNYGLQNVTVISDDETEIVVRIDQNVAGASYRVEKLNEFGDSFDALGTYSQNLASNGQFLLADFLVDNSIQSDQYRVIAIDSCSNDVSVSPIMNSIHLEIYPEDGDISNVLSWNPFVNWGFPVQEYQVFFSHNEQFPSDPKFVIDPQATFKVDLIEEFFHSESDFCYRVDAIESNTGKVSQSNVHCVSHKPRFYLPNAMVINGQNPVFKPKGGFIDFETYELSIYNRWGILLFQTNDFFEGWDGTFKGEYVKEGVYAYTLRYKTGDALERNNAGTLTVLRAF